MAAVQLVIHAPGAPGLCWLGLAGSAAVVRFGRASSDGVFRAVLWDVVIPPDHQGQELLVKQSSSPPPGK